MNSDRIEGKDAVSLVKNLNNHIERYLYSLYDRKKFEDCSLMNMWVSDFLFDNQGREVYQKDIEEEFFINRATASKMLTLMEEKQLIRRTASETDARLKKIELLPKGNQLHELCVVVRRKLDDALTKNMSPEESAAFEALCRKMIVNMETE